MNVKLSSLLPNSPHKPWIRNLGQEDSISINYFLATNQSLVGTMVQAIKSKSTFSDKLLIKDKINDTFGDSIIDADLTLLETTYSTETDTCVGLIFDNPNGLGKYWIEVRKPVKVA